MFKFHTVSVIFWTDVSDMRFDISFENVCWKFLAFLPYCIKVLLPNSEKSVYKAGYIVLLACFLVEWGLR